MEQTVTRPHPQPFLRSSIMNIPSRPSKGVPGCKRQKLFIDKSDMNREPCPEKIKIMPGVLINDPDFLLMDKSLRKYIRTKLFRRRVPDTYAIFRTNPSFMGRVKIYFVDIAFRKPGIGTGIVSHLPAVFITINALRSSYP